ncbi:transposase [Streptomyces mirabilis]|uniref:transposase n=1 Tax=Streptomyces mirabilis TaxID=68239 RepID=UPI00076601C8
MLDAVRYLVDNGVKWMPMPVDFPYWRAVYDFFRRWLSAYSCECSTKYGDTCTSREAVSQSCHPAGMAVAGR